MVEQIEMQKKVDGLVHQLMQYTEQVDQPISSGLIKELTEFLSQSIIHARILIVSILFHYAQKMHALCLVHETPSLVH